MLGRRNAIVFLSAVIASLALSDGAPKRVRRSEYPGVRSSRNGGSVYVRWGNTVCPRTSEMVYTGATGGSHYTKTGGAANFLCLPSEPEFPSDQPPVPDSEHALIYGVEYEVYPLGQHQHETLCAVCWSPRSVVLMVPAKNSCPEGWTLEYSGYIMANLPHDGRPSSEYICVDSRLEDRFQAGVANNNQGVLYFTRARCGSLPCPPYVENKTLGCVVCSK